MLAHLLHRVQAPVACATTLGFSLGGQVLDLPKSYQGFLTALRECLEKGGRYAALEMTSEALRYGFAKAWPCQVAVLTNLSHDHLQQHGSAEHYLASKAQLFMHLPAGGLAVLNGCDEVSPLLARVLPADVRAVYYGVSSRGAAIVPLQLVAKQVEVGWSGRPSSMQFAARPCGPELRPHEPPRG